MTDKTTAPELPARIWAFEDYPGQGAVPRSGMWCDEQSETPEGSPCYIRRDLCASGQVRASDKRICAALHRAAETLDYAQTKNTLKRDRVTYSSAADECRRVIAALTPAPQPEGQTRPATIAHVIADMMAAAGEPRPNGDILTDVLCQVLPALEAYGREKVREGMKRAADIGWVMAERDDIRGAILAEMEKERGNA